MESQSLILRDNIKHDLLQIKTVEDGVTNLNKLNAIEVWVKAEKKDAELQNIIAEQKLRTQRILGTLLKSSDKNTGAMGIGKSVLTQCKDTPTKISQFGLNHRQSSTFQQIADIPEEDFEEFITIKKEAVNNAVAELTTTGAVRLAKSIKQKNKELDVISDLNDQIRIEKELKNLAHTVNTKYTKDQRKFFITFIKI